MDYAAFPVPSYQHLMGSATPSHMGSKSKVSSTSNTDTPGSGLGGGGAKENNPGGASPGRIGSGGTNDLGM